MSGTVTRRADSADLCTRYDLDYVEALKVTIPVYARTWSKPSRCWTVHEPFVDAAIRLARSHFGAVEVLDLRADVAPAVSARTWAAAMFDALPQDLHRPVYRALARVLHPDQGGQTRAAAALNAAWSDRVDR